MSQAEERLRELHVETREELARADAKATTLFGVVSLFLGALLAGATAGHFDPRNLDNAVEWLFWVGISAGLLSVALLAEAVRPRVRHSAARQQLRYFGHVAGYPSVRGFREALAVADSSFDRRLDQVHILSLTTVRKYRRVGWAVWCLYVAVAACVGAELADHWCC